MEIMFSSIFGIFLGSSMGEIWLLGCCEDHECVYVVVGSSGSFVVL